MNIIQGECIVLLNTSIPATLCSYLNCGRFNDPKMKINLQVLRILVSLCPEVCPRTSGTMGSNTLCTILSALVVVAMVNASELQIVQSNGKFSGQLYKILSRKPGNVIFSPLSAHTVLSLSYLGALGSTQDAYVKSLALPDKKTTAEGYKAVSGKLASEKDIDLYLANKIYVAKDAKLNSKFSKDAIENFNAEIENIDFGANAEAAKTINSWVEQKTAHKIKELFSNDGISSETRLVLLNAIYFKGTWDKSFKAANTRTEPFYVNENEKIDVQMMHNREDNFGYKYDEALKAKILEMKFKNNDFNMVIILPNDKDGIKDLEPKLQTVDLTKIADGLRSSKVSLALPKFKIETEIHLEEALQELGLGEIFANSANFTDLLENNIPLKVDKVIQKAFIEVNEKGAEAAAATGQSFVPPLPTRAVMPTYFLADHPFIVILRHKEIILFQGRVSHPVSGDATIAPKGEPEKDPFAHINHIAL